MPLEVGSILEGKIVKITGFGAFVKVEGDKVGLVHISEISNSYVTDINKVFKIDDVVKVKVLSIADDGKISLSIKQAQPQMRKSGPVELDFSRKSSYSTTNKDALEDKISKFMKESDERLQYWKKSYEPKRSGSGNRKATQNS